MAKKLKYPYQEWKERQDPVDTGGSRSHYVTPETDQRATTTKKLGLPKMSYLQYFDILSGILRTFSRVKKVVLGILLSFLSFFCKKRESQLLEKYFPEAFFNPSQGIFMS
jgi:hypothetical protein